MVGTSRVVTPRRKWAQRTLSPSAGAVMLVPLLLALGGCRQPAEMAGRGDPRPQDAPAGPTFAADVAPLLARNCVECHRPGSVAPFPLVSYEDVRRRARQIVEVTASGYMPPWQPAPGFGEFRDERRLAAGEIELLERWVGAGSPRGDASALPPLGEPASGWRLGEPDLTLTLGAPYVVPAGGPDLFRNLVLDIPLEERRWVRAVELLPANPQVVHHMTLLADQSGLAHQLDALDEEPGYAGMEGGVDPGGHFIGWTPGKRPYPFPPGLAWTLEPGTDLVLQVHLLPSGKTEEVRPRIGLHFGDEPPTNEPVMLHLSSMTIDVPAGESTHPVRDELEVPVDVEALSIYPHAHYYCRSMDVFAVLPGGERVPLVRIDDWDFNWQDEYVYRRPIALPAGTTVHMHYVYDNSEANPRNPFRPPRRATWGASTYDAMADVWLKVVPRRREEVATLREIMDRLDRQRLEEAYRQVLRRRPDDSVVRARLGHLLVARGDSESAIAHLERSLAERPGRWNALHDLGVARARLGELEEARAALVAALEGNPDYAASHAALASVLVLLERSEEAVPHYRRALELRPDDAEAHNNFGFVLARAGEDDEAERHYRAAVRLEPELVEAWRNLGTLLGRSERWREAEEAFAEAAAVRPDDGDAHKRRAVALAHLRREAESEAALRRAVTLDPDDAEAHLFLARLLLGQGRFDEAKRELAAVLRIEPRHEEARRALERLTGV